MAKNQRSRTDTTHQTDTPIIMTETLSRAYNRNHPEVKRKDIIKFKIFGIGLSSGSALQ